MKRLSSFPFFNHVAGSLTMSMVSSMSTQTSHIALHFNKFLKQELKLIEVTLSTNDNTNLQAHKFHKLIYTLDQGTYIAKYLNKYLLK